MKKLLILLFVVGNTFVGFTQRKDVLDLMETARAFQRGSDYANAALVLNKALESAPGNLDLIRELAFTFYLDGQNDKALSEVKKIIDREDADEQTFQVAGLIYKSRQDLKEAEKLYRRGLKKFPGSGALYNEFGEVLYQKEPASSAGIKAWEKGIELDPGYSRNYYNACRYYGTTGNNLWCLLYGEIFVNLESYTTRTIEIKNILFDIYKLWFVAGSANSTIPFELQFVSSLNKQSKESALGISAEVLTAIRTRFILDWFNSSSSRPAFRLFEYHRQLLQEGLFEAYNQWLFGSVSSAAAYQNWVSTHPEESSAFINFQKGRIFKIPAGQYYGRP